LKLVPQDDIPEFGWQWNMVMAIGKRNSNSGVCMQLHS
jgi:hypothetical protein